MKYVSNEQQRPSQEDQANGRGPTESFRLSFITVAWLAALIGFLPALPAATAAEPSVTTTPGVRAVAVVPIGTGQPGFKLLSPTATGVAFTNLLPVTRHYTNQIYLNGSGVAAGDLDGDGRPDLILAGLGGGTAIFHNLGDWRFENVTARSGVDFSRLDVTGVTAADLDGDGDLDLVLNTVGQGTHLLENLGRGEFAPFAAVGTVNPGLCGSTCSLADVDGDGRLDLYVANYRVITSRDEPHLSFAIGQEDGRPKVKAYGQRPITDPSLANRFKFSYQPKADGGASVFHDEQGEPDGLYHNDGAGRWTRVPWTNGVFLDESGAPLGQPPFDWGLSAMFRDLNGDGAPDLYVCNDFATPDRIWINDGRGRFRALPPHAIRQTSLSTMAVDVADIDRDGFDDLFTADMLSPDRWRRLVQINQVNPNMHLFTDMATRPQAPRNMLQRNRGDGTYEEIAQLAGLEASEWSWASIFLDVDLDGFEDLLVANGFERDFMNMDAHRRVRAAQARLPRNAPPGARLAANRLYPRLATPNLAFRNLGHLQFADASRDWGFDVAEISQGMALADFDQDGDLDVIINNLNGPASLLRNESTAPRLAVRLIGRAPNTRGIGARIVVFGGAVPRQSQEMIAGGRYLSSDDPMRVFAAGSTTNRLAIEVQWRSGKVTTLSNLNANTICEIIEPDSAPRVTPPPATATPASTPSPAKAIKPLFVDVSDRLSPVAPSGSVDDFAVQSMLPARLSQLGPGVTWQDVNGDGWDDLLLPGTAGAIAVLENDQRGGFKALQSPTASGVPKRTSASVVGWSQTNGVALWIGFSAHTTRDASNAPAVQLHQVFAGQLTNAGSGLAVDASVGPLALADIDGDGDLDLFVGGRHVPDHWPEPASSRLFLQSSSLPAGQWEMHPASSNLLARLGMVSGALFTDLDADGDPDLVVTCDWGSIRIFRNDRGQFTATDWKVTFPNLNPRGPITRAKQLSELTGWWTGIQAGDFDGDGRLDLLAGNLGRNSAYERHRARPLRVYYGTLAGDDSTSIVECAFDGALGKYAPLRDVWTLAKNLPWLLERFDSYEKFARVGIEDALAERFAQARFVEAGWADSTVFLNRGDHFEAHTLPDAAQRAPAMGVCVADFDGDGQDDAFLGQNFFATRPDASRQDAGRGLLLRGDGRGGFSAVAGAESGLLIYGEQRGAAVSDFNHDGRPDLAVSQGNGPLRLMRNDLGRPGLRVRLHGPPQNPQAIGAVLRLGNGTRWSPAREIHAGSGYWSQDSAEPIVTGPIGANRLQVRWPGGKVAEITVPTGATEISAQISVR